MRKIILLSVLAAMLGIFGLMNQAQAFDFGDVFAGVGNGTIKVFSRTGTLKQTLVVALH